MLMMDAKAEWHFEYIIASFLVSCLGAATSLVLMSQRTSGTGRQNWWLLVIAALSLGGVAIFGMYNMY